MLNYHIYRMKSFYTVKIESDFKYEIRKTMKIDKLHDFIWFILSIGQYRKYVVLDNNKIIASAIVMPKIYKFAFISEKNAVHIEPCITFPDYRNQGIYKNLLRKICLDYQEKDRYIFCSKENIASLKGIESVGFELIGEGKKGRLGIYKFI